MVALRKRVLRRTIIYSEGELDHVFAAGNHSRRRTLAAASATCRCAAFGVPGVWTRAIRGYRCARPPANGWHPFGMHSPRTTHPLTYSPLTPVFHKLFRAPGYPLSRAKVCGLR